MKSMYYPDQNIFLGKLSTCKKVTEKIFQMGQTLSEPIVEKHTTSGSDKRIIWAASDMQGWRISNFI
jgi:hypothetical protein